MFVRDLGRLVLAKDEAGVFFMVGDIPSGLGISKCPIPHRAEHTEVLVAWRYGFRRETGVRDNIHEDGIRRAARDFSSVDFEDWVIVAVPAVVSKRNAPQVRERGDSAKDRQRTAAEEGARRAFEEDVMVLALCPSQLRRLGSWGPLPPPIPLTKRTGPFWEWTPGSRILMEWQDPEDQKAMIASGHLAERPLPPLPQETRFRETKAVPLQQGEFFVFLDTREGMDALLEKAVETGWSLEEVQVR